MIAPAKASRQNHSAARLPIGGGSRLDHSAYRSSFNTVQRDSGLVFGRDAIITGLGSDKQCRL